MTAQEAKQQKARQMRYKKPIAKDLNLYSIKDYLYDMEEQCASVQWMVDDEDTLTDALDGDEEGALEFRMMFADLEADCERMMEDLQEWKYDDRTVDMFNLFFVTAGAGDDFGGLLGYDSVESDYFGIDAGFMSQKAEEEARKKVERLTKKELLDLARWCFKVYQNYISLRYRYDCLEASLNILQEKNKAHMQIIKDIEELYDAAEAETGGFAYGWMAGEASRALDRAINMMPPEVWVW